MTDQRFHWSFCLSWSLVICLCGCSTWDLKSKMPWASSEEKIKQEKFQRPVRMVAIWSPTTVSAPGKGVTRGLGGRLYFYNDEGETIPVEGQLIVYAYDDSNRKQNVSHVNTTGGVDEPDRKFAFTPEQFTNHFSPTDLGASYSVWVPWGPLDGPPAKVSLVPVFTSTGGNVVMAQASRNLLAGTIPAALADNGQEMTPSQQAAVRPAPQARRTELRTTTIPVPEVTAERIRRGGEMPFPTPDERTPQNADPMNTAPASGASANFQTTTQTAASLSRATTAPGRGVPPPWMPPLQPPTRFEPPKFQVPAGPAPQPDADRGPMPPNPSTPPYGQPSTRESNSVSPNQESFSAGPQTAAPGW